MRLTAERISDDVLERIERDRVQGEVSEAQVLLQTLTSGAESADLDSRSVTPCG